MSSGVMRNKEAVRSAIARIADDLGKGNITQEELDRARNPILNSMDRAQRDNGYWTSLLKDSPGQAGTAEPAEGKHSGRKSHHRGRGQQTCQRHLRQGRASQSEHSAGSPGCGNSAC